MSDRLVEARFGDEGGSGAVGFVVGAAVVDGIPESLISGVVGFAAAMASA